MRERRAFAGRTPSAAVVALVLVVFALSGLGAGVLTRSALGGMGMFASPTATATTPPTATATLTPSPSPSTTPTSTLTPTVPSAGSFTIQVTLTPNSVASGASFTVLVVARDSTSAMPIQGVVCTLRAPKGDTNPLFTSWPSPQITDASGRAQWQLTAPAVPPGAYTLEVFAQRGDGSTFTWQRTLTIVS